jgi:hypothetical protein
MGFRLPIFWASAVVMPNAKVTADITTMVFKLASHDLLEVGRFAALMKS